MDSPEEGFQRVFLSKKSERDLLKLKKRDPVNFYRVWKDLKRFDQGTLPQLPKKLRGFPDLWQFDSGDFRVVYRREADSRFILVTVLPKSGQKARFRALR